MIHSRYLLISRKNFKVCTQINVRIILKGTYWQMATNNKYNVTSQVPIQIQGEFIINFPWRCIQYNHKIKVLQTIIQFTGVVRSSKQTSKPNCRKTVKWYICANNKENAFYVVIILLIYCNTWSSVWYIFWIK